jgi:pimeloyl-ACP methyl ester carboxylesterase
MNSRERVLKAFKRLPGLPDRVPVQFELCRQLSDHFGKELGIPVHYTDNPYEDVTYRISANELRVAMGSDVVVTGAAVSDDYKILMGTSTGGTLALQMAADYPDIVAAVILYSPNVRIANKASFLLGGPFGLQLGRMISGGKYRILAEDPKTDPFWNNKYRVEAVVYLQKLVVKTMKPSVFKKVTQPVFVGYYYKDKEHQDNTVSVPKILWMYEKLGTASDKKVSVAFPDAGAHVIGCDLTNPNWMKVYTATESFLIKTVGLTPVKTR